MRRIKKRCEFTRGPVEDAKKPVHELQIRQIGLKMQNAELRRAKRVVSACPRLARESGSVGGRRPELGKRLRHTSARGHSHFGFTLIELLVVIALIAILAALLLPVLAKAKERGRSARCLSNLRQLALSATIYADEYGQALPWSEKHCTAPSNPNGMMNYTDPTAANFHINAYWLMWNYAGRNDGLWQCPSALEDKAATVSGVNSPLLGYMGNMFAIGVSASPMGLGPDILPKHLPALPNASRAKLFTDVGVNWQGVWVGATYQTSWSTAPVVPVPLHRASLNAVLADGHTDQISGREFSEPGGPAVSFQGDSRQNWWRDGAVAFLP